LTIKIIIVGKTKDDSLRTIERSYQQRIARYCSIEVVAVRPGKSLKGSNSSPALREEAERMLRDVRQEDFVVALDSGGKPYTSAQLARFLDERQISGTRRLIFLTGGPLGLDPVVKTRADLVLSFSKLTFTHEMIRILLLEQLYRAWTIIRGEKYHK
jgi:23S rRNA (pseudouridine1915-N3)-methyltransferase